MGYLHLTFEYHSHKDTLKIKVWQLSDLLLPPRKLSLCLTNKYTFLNTCKYLKPCIKDYTSNCSFLAQTSSIHSIYIKSFLLPDLKKDSRRKTEEIKVDRAEAHQNLQTSTNKGGIQHVFSPSTFKFSKKLEYEGVSPLIIKEKSVQIEVCITQKYSKRSFLIGMLHMPLKEAVKKIVREKYSLIPCVNPTIPANMRVYCASQLQITDSAKIFYSNPDFRNLSESDMSEISQRASSDPNLKGVTTMSESITPRNVVLDISGDLHDELVKDPNRDDKDIDNKRSVRVVIPGEFVEEELEESGYNSNTNVIDMTDISNDNSKPTKKSAFSSVVKHVKMNTGTKVQNLKESAEQKTASDVSLVVEDWKYNEVKQKSGSRPETPTWDYYDLSMRTIEIPFDGSENPTQGEAPVCLPMETTLGVMQPKVKKKAKTSQEEIEASMTEKTVPVIVVTDTNGGVSRSSNKRKTKGHHKKKKSRNETVSIDMQSFVKPTKSRDGKFTVTADIHIPCATKSLPETSIDIGDTDSVIIDIENFESELRKVEIAESVDDSVHDSTSTTTSHVVTATEALSSNLTAMRPVPQQVFIDDSLYESGDDTSEMSEFTLPFVPLTSQNNHMVSEV